MHPSDCSSEALQSVLAALPGTLEVSIWIILQFWVYPLSTFFRNLTISIGFTGNTMNKTVQTSWCFAHTVQHSTLKLQQTDSQPYGELFTLASTLRKSCNCGKVNDMLPPKKLQEAQLLVCSFREEVKYSFNKLHRNSEGDKQLTASAQARCWLIVRLEITPF